MTVPPPELEPWLVDNFGSVDAVRSQRIVRVTNLATLDSTIFAALRARRPMADGAEPDITAEIAASEGDPFCNPERGTPADRFGRVRGTGMITGANAGLAEAYHAVLVFDRHDPLAYDAELVADAFATGRRWADAAARSDPAARHYLLIWNCLWRAGGSIVHGHAQVLLGRSRPHAAMERFGRSADGYRERHGRDLTADIATVHEDLGLAVRSDDVTVFAHLTPIKEREVVVVGPRGTDEREPAFAGAVGRTLIAMRDRLGVRSFNLALWRRPLDDDQGPGPLVRIVDRGDLARRASDIGAMELYATPIVASDPYDVIGALTPA